MKIIVAGLQKTGTLSMCVALQSLGYNTYHYIDNFLKLHKEWVKIYETGGTTEDFYQMFKDVDAVADMPCAYYWDEILKAFPDAKIILTIRDDEETWMKSMEKQQDAEATPMLHIMGYFSPTFRKFYKYHRLTRMTIYGTFAQSHWFKPTPHNMMLLRMFYHRHNSHVMQNAPKDQLLVYNVKEGWEPLCKFLGIEVPDQPFPHVNVGGSVVADDLQNRPYFKRCRYEMQFSLLLISLLSGFGIYKLVKSSTLPDVSLNVSKIFNHFFRS